MGSRKEVEIKFRVENPQALARRLRAARFRRQSKPTHELNTLYDLPGQPLRKCGELLRLRRYGAGELLRPPRDWVAPRSSRERPESVADTGYDLERLAAAWAVSG